MGTKSNSIPIGKIQNAVKAIPKPASVRTKMNLHQGVSSRSVLVLLGVLRKACKKEIAACYALRNASAALNNKMLFMLQEKADQKRIGSFIALKAEGNKWKITMICTTISFRKRGMGRYLIQLIIHIICKQYKSKLSVLALPNVRAFYEKNGFRFIKNQDGQALLEHDKI